MGEPPATYSVSRSGDRATSARVRVRVLRSAHSRLPVCEGARPRVDSGKPRARLVSNLGEFPSDVKGVSPRASASTLSLGVGSHPRSSFPAGRGGRRAAAGSRPRSRCRPRCTSPLRRPRLPPRQTRQRLPAARRQSQPRPPDPRPSGSAEKREVAADVDVPGRRCDGEDAAVGHPQLRRHVRESATRAGKTCSRHPDGDDGYPDGGRRELS